MGTIGNTLIDVRWDAHQGGCAARHAPPRAPAKGRPSPRHEPSAESLRDRRGPSQFAILLPIGSMAARCWRSATLERAARQAADDANIGSGLARTQQSRKNDKAGDVSKITLRGASIGSRHAQFAPSRHQTRRGPPGPQPRFRGADSYRAMVRATGTALARCSAHCASSWLMSSDVCPIAALAPSPGHCEMALRPAAMVSTSRGPNGLHSIGM